MSSLELPPYFPRGASARAADRLYPRSSVYKDRPDLWVEERLREFIWSKQREIMMSLVNHKQTAVKSCHGSGKSHIMARAIGWWLDPSVHALGSAFAITTAPSWPQVQAVLWRYLKRVHVKARLPGRITMECQYHMSASNSKLRIGDPTEELIAMGRKPADYDEDSLQGIHARWVLGVIDEANGVPEQLFTSILSVCTNDDSRIVAIGNPEDPESHFAEICRPGSGWNVIEIPAWCVPTITEEVCQEFGRHRAAPEERVPDEVAKELLSANWIRERAHDWGIGSMKWQGKIEAEFPEITDETLFSPKWLKKVVANELPGLELGQFALDVARYGADKSVMYWNRGGQIRLHKEWAKMDTEETADIAAGELDKLAPNRLPIVVDAIGVGAGPFDKLRRRGYKVKAFYGSERAFNPKRFKNRRSEVYYTLRELGDDLVVDLDESDEKLLNQLGSLRWWTDTAGRIVVEPKEEFQERLGVSPDYADSAVMSTVSRGSLKEHGQAGESNSLTGDLLKKVM